MRGSMVRISLETGRRSERAGTHSAWAGILRSCKSHRESRLRQRHGYCQRSPSTQRVANDAPFAGCPTPWTPPAPGLFTAAAVVVVDVVVSVAVAAAAAAGSVTVERMRVSSGSPAASVTMLTTTVLPELVIATKQAHQQSPRSPKARLERPGPPRLTWHRRPSRAVP